MAVRNRALVGVALALAGVAAGEDTPRGRTLWTLDFTTKPAEEELLHPNALWADAGDGKVAVSAAGKIHVFDKKTGALSKSHVLQGLESAPATIAGRHLLLHGPRQKPARPAPAPAPRGGGAGIGFGDPGPEPVESSLQAYDLATGKLVLEDLSASATSSGEKLVLRNGDRFEGFDLAKSPRRLWSVRNPAPAPAPARGRGGFAFTGDDPPVGTIFAGEDGAVCQSHRGAGAGELAFLRFDWKAGAPRLVTLPKPRFDSFSARLAGPSLLVLRHSQRPQEMAGYDLERKKLLYEVTHDFGDFADVGPPVGVYAVFSEVVSARERGTRIVDLRSGKVVLQPTVVSTTFVSNRGVAWIQKGPESAWSTVTLDRDGNHKTTATFASELPCPSTYQGKPWIFATRSSEKVELLAIDPWAGVSRTIHECAARVEDDSLAIHVLATLPSGEVIVAEVRHPAKGGEPRLLRVIALGP